mmetsp:Transcript_3770/g.5000  ORF Transcript_3770/g.5000 Transcript_3770/m.5000 type:complete len:287 (+) Transcript_3770:190-1050(+)|eukprot:CAMPEP_0198141742 /NCGR_PEP_ID=MMETSP1443-20131203/4692_1 /TAXON_ID=186043 /ORGANISM="Entomoneis sp., Strain CCMP2396" /LENGTH=286 /DNA_ID=CAMNT_0043804571 /DNA_START=150 /DNA_END=1010 /DNA_ORIENTATION=-
MQLHHQQQQQLQQKQREYFIVQKCWFDGPNVQPSQDYLALFSTRASAEQVASQSAHLHAAQRHSVVRTILLPTTSSSYTTTTSYAFSAAGELFWVRSVFVNVDHCDVDATASAVDATNSTKQDGAHVILVGQVIGGTGNRNSRRGSEAQTGAVFVGPNSHARALEVIKRDAIQSKIITWIPLATTTPGSNSNSKFLAGWTGKAAEPVAAAAAAAAKNNNDTTTLKRPNNNYHNHHFQNNTNNHNNTNNNNNMMMELDSNSSACAYSSRPLKRVCAAAPGVVQPMHM